MRLTHALDDILGQKGKVKILRYLTFASGNLTARGISRRTGLTPWACIKTLRELETLGLIKMERAGRSNLYILNNQNYVNKKILLPLFKKEKDLVNTAITWIIKKIHFKPISIVLFGSIVRGQEEMESDIDLCILVKDTQEAQIAEEEFLRIAPLFFQKYSKKLSPYISVASSFKEKYEKSIDVVRDIVLNGIHICGEPISAIIK